MLSRLPLNKKDDDPQFQDSEATMFSISQTEAVYSLLIVNLKCLVVMITHSVKFLDLLKLI